MHPTSLLTAYQGGQALVSLGDHAERRFKRLKIHELATLRAFCDEMKAQGCGVAELDGFFVGYAIERISKEFDLLRFSNALILNIELKAPLRRADKEEKIRRQMRTNHHYLSFLGRPLRLFTFVDKDGFYEYLPQQDQLTRADAAEIADLLRTQKVDPALDPDTLFVPANYLISPFRDSARFIKGQYFLTTSQQSVKEEILRERKKYPDTCFTLSAASGTGKTLLLYDLAKTIRAEGGRAALVHCAPLNEDQRSFRRAHGWCIHSAADVQPAALACQADLLLVDETQHLSLSQLNALIAAAETSHTTLLLAFDTAPELGVERPAAILAALRHHHPRLRLSAKSLSDKIRINSAPWLHSSPIFSSRKPSRPILLTIVSPLTTSTSQTIFAPPPLISAARDGPSSPEQLPDLGSLSQNAVRVTSRPSSAANFLALPPFSTVAFSTIPPVICRPPTRPVPPKQPSTRSSPAPPTSSA